MTSATNKLQEFIGKLILKYITNLSRECLLGSALLLMVFVPESGLSNFLPCTRFSSGDREFDPLGGVRANETFAPIPTGPVFI